MNPDILCRWLGLPSATWPPEPYTLLGLPPGERNPERIEQKVHERMTQLRGYQISHPEEATEGMNRVAQAFVALTACDGPSPAVQTATEEPVTFTLEPAPTATETRANGPTRVDWQAAPPPIRRSGTLKALPPRSVPAAATSAPPPPNAKPVAPTEASSAIVEQHPECLDGLRSLPAVIDRIYHTRHLLVAWNTFGRLFRGNRRRTPRATDEQDFARRLRAIDAQVAEFPAILGCPGKPGYRVVAMARLGMTLTMFHALEPAQRELFTVDWIHGRDVLLNYRKFLRAHFKKMRRRGPVSLAFHGLRSVVRDYPGAILSGLAVAAGLAFWFWWKH